MLFLTDHAKNSFMWCVATQNKLIQLYQGVNCATLVPTP